MKSGVLESREEGDCGWTTEVFDDPLGAAYMERCRVHEEFGRHNLIKDADGLE